VNPPCEHCCYVFPLLTFSLGGLFGFLCLDSQALPPFFSTSFCFAFSVASLQRLTQTAAYSFSLICPN
ncbi:hypothetical protein BGW80DRAFT_1341256, partial [Lactifluus volemus]